MPDFRTEIKKELEGITARLAADVALIHSARATPALVENLQVEIYGQKMPLNQVASLSAPDARTIIVQPWDPTALSHIRKAIENSSLGMGIIPDEKFLRLVLPQLSTERRAEILKTIGKKVEETRISIRRVRDHASKAIEGSFRAKELSEDEKFRRKESLQKTIDETIGVVGALEERKTKEIEG